MSHTSEIEVLVHFAAPGSAADDTRYRSLAEAYLNFTPARRTDVVRGIASPERPVGSPLEARRSSQTSACSDALETFGGTQASFSSVLDNAGSPRVRVPTAGVSVEGYGGENGSYVSDTQVESQQDLFADHDSYPEFQSVTIEEFNSPERVMQYFKQRRKQQDCDETVVDETSFGGIETVPSSVPLVDEYDTRDHSPSSATPQEHTVLTHTIPSSHPPETPENIPSTNATASPSSPHVDTSQPPPSSIPIHTRSPPKPDARTSLQRCTSEPTIAATHAPTLTKTTSDLGSLSRWTARRQTPLSRADVQQRVQEHERRASAAAPPPREFQEQFYDALEIYSPEPAVADVHVTPDDLITPKLHQVSADLNIVERFGFRVQRAVQPLERGFWRIDTRAWPRALAQAAWRFLANWVGAGFAGWGTRCYRDEKRTWLRVYCWGVVIGPIYGLVYLASERRLKTERSEWIDGDGEAVVVVEAREGRRGRAE
ncbi:hypothetical protein BROUX41_003210 [Berkeleyomyces rouxiae]|uniref:uncharacterized protein n=1 Tax=Berkeleyomyces rouxiae TaxID=2035830 RepID=UPI003B77C953